MDKKAIIAKHLPNMVDNSRLDKLLREFEQEAAGATEKRQTELRPIGYVTEGILWQPKSNQSTQCVIVSEPIFTKRVPIHLGEDIAALEFENNYLLRVNEILLARGK